MKIGQPLRMPDEKESAGGLAPNTLPPSTPGTPPAVPTATVTPTETPNTPPAAVEVKDDEKVVKFDDFDRIKSGGILTTTPSKEPPKPGETTKEVTPPAVKSGEVVPPAQPTGKEVIEPVQDPTKLIPPPKVVAQPNQPDILEGLSEFEKDLLTKKASKEVREYVASTLRKNKEKITTLEKENVELKNTGNGKLPQNYNEHPDAFVFDPEYTETAQTMSNLQTELGFYEQQLIKIEKGEKWNELNYDEKTGQYSIGEAKEGTAESKRDLENRILNGRIMHRELNTKVSSIKTQHTLKHQAYIKRFKEIEDKYFPDFVDETKIDETDKQRIKTSTEMLKSLGQGNNPLTPILAKLYTMQLKYANYIRSNEERYASIGRVPAKHEIGPSSEEIRGGARPGSNGSVVPAKDDMDTPIKFDAFDAIKNRS